MPRHGPDGPTIDLDQFVGCRMPNDMTARIDAEAERRGLKRSEMVRVLIGEGFELERLVAEGFVVPDECVPVPVT